MTIGIILLVITAMILSFLWRNWDDISTKMTEEGERKFKIVIGIVLGCCFLGIIVCCATGVYNYR